MQKMKTWRPVRNSCSFGEVHHRRVMVVLAITLILALILAFPVSSHSTDYDFSDRMLLLNTGSNADAVAIGDFNNDGLKDVALLTSYASDPDGMDFTLFVFLQNEWHQLGAPTTYKTRGWGYRQGIATGDLNHDGKADIVVCNSSGGVEVFLQNESGTFNPSTFYPTSNAHLVRVADMNNDGLLDVVVSGPAAMDIFYQNGSGTLNFPVTLTVPNLYMGFQINFSIGDMNNDGLKDLIVLTQDSAAWVSVMFQTKDGTFGTPVPCFSEHRGIDAFQVGDVNGDGLDDVVLTTRPEYLVELHVSYQNKLGSLDSPVVISTFANLSFTMAIADVNGDGRNDVLFKDDGWGRILVFHQNASGQLSFSNSYPCPDYNYSPQGIAIGDFNNDGLPDIAATSNNVGLVLLYHARPTPSIDTAPYPVNFTTPVGKAASKTVTVANYDIGDLKVGKITLQATDSQFQITSDGCSSQSVPFLTTCTFTITFAPSSKGYKKTYAVIPSNDPLRPNVEIPVYGNVPFHDLFHPAVSYSPGSEPMAVAIGDLNSDGRNDVALVMAGYGSYPGTDFHLLVFPQDPSSGWLLAPAKYPLVVAGSLYGGAQSVDIGDVTGDGRADVVAALEIAGQDSNIMVFPQNGSGALDPLVPYSGRSFSVKTGDFNNDGLIDVAGMGWGKAGAAYTTVDVYLQNSNHTLASTPHYAPYSGFNQITSGDVNGDGLTDIVVMNGETSPEITVITQKKDGTLTQPHSYVSAYGSPWSVAVGDVNGDGREDIVFTYWYAPKIGVLLQKPDGTLAPEVSYDTNPNPMPVRIADVNGDGLKDVVIYHGGDLMPGYLGVFLQDKDGTLMPEEMYKAPSGSLFYPEGLAVGDVNNDGLPDVAVAHYGGALIMIYHKGSGPVPYPATLTVSAKGKGQGTVTGPGISCTGTCGHAYQAGTAVTLTATAQTGSKFNGWNGCVSVTKGACRVMVSQDMTVTATFIAEPPHIVISSSTLAFGTGKLGHPTSLPLTVSNSGPGNLANIDPHVVGTGEFSVTGTTCTGLMTKGQSCVITVTLLPASYGNKSAELRIYSNDTPRSPVKVRLSAMVAPPRISLTPTAISFGPHQTGATSAARTVTVKNTGVSDLSIDTVSLTGDSAFKVSGNTCSTVAQGEKCVIEVTFGPTAAGPAKSTLHIHSNAASGPGSVSLTGRGNNVTASPAAP